MDGKEKPAGHCSQVPTDELHGTGAATKELEGSPQGCSWRDSASLPCRSSDGDRPVVGFIGHASNARAPCLAVFRPGWLVGHLRDAVTTGRLQTEDALASGAAGRPGRWGRPVGKSDVLVWWLLQVKTENPAPVTGSGE